MTKRQLTGSGLFVLFQLLAVSAAAQTWGISPDYGDEPYVTRPPRRSWPDYSATISRVVGMPTNGELQQRVQRYGLNVVNVMWEDTGRYVGSSVGPNISDLTLQVRERVGGRLRTHLLPVIRFPNFSDRTADIDVDKIWVRVGNQDDEGDENLEPIRLVDVLSNMRDYLSNPESLRGSDNFLSDRDTHFLVGAQAVFMPLNRQGKAEFNPVLFNYQSSPGNPAVLVLVITRHGTSATIVENRPGDQTMQGWGQQLFFNHAGQRTTFTAERRTAVANRIEQQGEHGQDVGALEEGADMLMIVQVPLRHSSPRYQYDMDEAEVPAASIGSGSMGGLADVQTAPAAPSAEGAGSGYGGPARRSMERSDVEHAVLGYGHDRGRFREMGGQRLVRDERFPIRITVQFYRATSNGIVSDRDLAAVQHDIQRVYSNGDYVGSLVVPRNQQHRPTSWVHNLFN